MGVGSEQVSKCQNLPSPSPGPFCSEIEDFNKTINIACSSDDQSMPRRVSMPNSVRASKVIKMKQGTGEAVNSMRTRDLRNGSETKSLYASKRVFFQTLGMIMKRKGS